MTETEKYLWEWVKENIKREIKEVGYKSGDILPSYRESCKKYSVSMPVVIHAYDSLEREGLIYKVCGKGIFLS
ncbi:MAG: winged helix-turn-helix domain-containing protein [Ruminococcus sp.]|nr:winged helix-turn-helix domain-containing protein [Ruminococcus sp.]